MKKKLLKFGLTVLLLWAIKILIDSDFWEMKSIFALWLFIFTGAGLIMEIISDIPDIEDFEK